MQTTFFGDENSLEEEKERQERVKWPPGKGTRCRACGRNVRGYQRPIYKQMARELIRLVRFYQRDQEFHHKDEFAKADGSAAKLRYWGLVREAANKNGKKTHSGLWIPTRLGIEFAMGKVRVPRYAYTYNEVVIRMAAGNTISIFDAAKKEFDVREVFGEYYDG